MIRFNYGVLIAVALAIINIEQTGVNIGWTSPMVAFFQSNASTVPLTKEQGSWLAASVPLVSSVSTPIAAICADTIGRKASLILGTLPFAIAFGMIAIGSSPGILIAARAISGIGMGFAYTICPIYIGEVATDRIRGALGSSMLIMINAGILLSYAICPFVDVWLSSLILVLPVLIVFVFCKSLPESPYWLVKKNRSAEAKESLSQLLGKEDVQKELEIVEFSMREHSGNIMQLFTDKNNLHSLVIILGVFTLQQYSGSASFLFFSHIIFEKAGNLVLSPNASALILSSLQLFVSVILTFLIDSLGRRPLMLLSTLGCGLAMALEGVYFFLQEQGADLSGVWWLPLVGMIVFNCFMAIGLGGIPLIFLSELFPTNVKAFAVCLAKSYVSVQVFVVAKVFQGISDSFGNYVPFYFFASCCSLGLLFIYFFVPETKGKPLEELHSRLNKKTSSYGSAEQSTKSA